ncbi:MAG: inositol monophosphatase [Candidatus Aminicenantes bacterium]|nr:inositol monophosphatase [Candidatus Aminicenantes bacterium]
MIRNTESLLEKIRVLHAEIRDGLIEACEHSSLDRLAKVIAEEAGDRIFAIDRISEEILLDRFSNIAQEWPCLLIAEGLGNTGKAVLPAGCSPEIVFVVDPIDGTRGLMYQKRPGWILTGVAPYRGEKTILADIEIAVQTEIPLNKQYLCDSLWAVSGQGTCGERANRITGEKSVLHTRPSRAKTIAEGFGGISRFFPGARSLFAAVDDELVHRILGSPPNSKAAPLAYEDQYISTAGQLYELMMGHDRWVADLRSVANPWLKKRGKPSAMCCHPYDLCTEMIAREAGVIIVNPSGGPLRENLDTESDCSWVGFANAEIRDQVLPVLQDLLKEHLGDF